MADPGRVLGYGQRGKRPAAAPAAAAAEDWGAFVGLHGQPGRHGHMGWSGRHAGIVAVGLHGTEEGNPPEAFADAFRVALDGTGLLSTPHAGEFAPAPNGPSCDSSAQPLRSEPRPVPT